MATKPKTVEVPEGFTDTTKATPIPEIEAETPAAPTPDPAPVRAPEQVIGWQPLSADEIRRVNLVKREFDGAIAMLKTLRDAYHDAEVQRMFAVAITNAETASMWAVRAITHRG
jgi:hypothetical protein